MVVKFTDHIQSQCILCTPGYINLKPAHNNAYLKTAISMILNFCSYRHFMCLDKPAYQFCMINTAPLYTAASNHALIMCSKSCINGPPKCDLVYHNGAC